MSERDNLPVGTFSSWLLRTQAAQGTRNGTDVPCGDCTACCTSSYFIHITPEETETLAMIPKALLFPAPGLPDGHVLMGYDEKGHCPMLTENQCSIYEHRPQTCRNYDCRVFPAAGLSVGKEGKVRIDEQARRWKFSFPAPLDREQHEAVQSAAAFLGERAELFPEGTVPSNATQLAVLAIRVHEVFLDSEGKTHRDVVDAVMKVLDLTAE